MKKVVFVLSLLSLFLGISCSNFSETENSSSLTVFLPGSSSRASVSESLSSYSIFLCPGQSLDPASLGTDDWSGSSGTLKSHASQYRTGIIPNGNVEFTDLDKGIYQVAVAAFNQSGTVIGAGISSASVEGGNTSVSITVKKVGKYIYISTPEDLRKINEAGNESANFILQNDIMINYGWTIENGHNLRGTFDGQGHKITFAVATAYPLFWEIEAGSEIKNLTVDGAFEAAAENNWSSFSPFTLKNCAGSTISNCSFKGTIRNLGGLSYVFGGGDGAIENCPGFTENISTGDTIYTVEYEFISPTVTFESPSAVNVQNSISQFKENIAEVYSTNQKYCKSSGAVTLTASNVSIRTPDGRTITSCGFYTELDNAYTTDDGYWAIDFVQIPTYTIPAGTTAVLKVGTLVDID